MTQEVDVIQNACGVKSQRLTDDSTAAFNNIFYSYRYDYVSDEYLHTPVLKDNSRVHTEAGA